MSVSSEQTTDTLQSRPGVSLPPLGEILRAKREEKNLTIDDVCSRLRLSPRQIKALEDNNFSMFSEPMMTRGFIRNYARLLEIDAEGLLEAYRLHVPNLTPYSISINSANVQLPDGAHPKLGKLWLSIAVLLLAVAGWYLYMEYAPAASSAKTAESITPLPATESPSEAVSNEPVKNNEALPEAALPLAERESGEGVAATAEPITSNTSPAVNAEAAPAANATPAEEPQREQTVFRISQDPAIPLKLEFVFNEASWVYVRDHTGNSVLNKTAQAGTREGLEAKLPVKIVLGNASGTQLLFAGQPIELAPYTRSNVVRITLSAK